MHRKKLLLFYNQLYCSGYGLLKYRRSEYARHVFCTCRETMIRGEVAIATCNLDVSPTLAISVRLG